MKILWCCALLSLLSVVAHGGIPAAPGGIVTVHSDNESPVVAATASSADAAASLAEYVLLHETRDTAVPLGMVLPAHVCHG